MILDEIAEVMSELPPRKMARKTGLSRDKVRRMAQGIPFNLDYNAIFALGRLGYHLASPRARGGDPICHRAE